MIIGIGGSSRSGKTTLTEALVWAIRSENKRVMAIQQDDFVKRLHDIPLIQQETDWETPASIDFELLKKAIVFLKDDFEVILVEGFLPFADIGLNALYDVCFFTTISEETFRIRKAADTRWGKIPAWYIDHIWESFLKYGQPSAGLPNFMEIDGEHPFKIEDIMTFLQTIVK